MSSVFNKARAEEVFSAHFQLTHTRKFHGNSPITACRMEFPNSLFLLKHTPTMSQGTILDPQQIHFTQKTIEAFFTNGQTSIFELLLILNAQKKPISDVPMMPLIRVAQYQGKYYSIDNRRLWVARKMKLPIKVEMIDSENLELRYKLRSLQGSEGIDAKVILNCKLCGQTLPDPKSLCLHIMKHRERLQFIPNEKYRRTTFPCCDSETWCPHHKDGKSSSDIRTHKQRDKSTS